MDWVATVIVGVLAFLGGTGVDRFYAAGRLRARLREEAEVYKALPEGSQAQRELLLHIERQAFLLIAEEEPLTTWEWMDRRWGRLFSYAVAPVLALQVFNTDRLWLRILLGVISATVFLYGQRRIARVERAVNLRKRAKRLRADIDNAEYAVPTGRQSVATALRALLPPYKRPQPVRGTIADEEPFREMDGTDAPDETGRGADVAATPAEESAAVRNRQGVDRVQEA